MPKTTTKNAREITSHRVNGLNEALRVFVIDEPGAGGANHEYVILRPMDEEETENLMEASDNLPWVRYELPEWEKTHEMDAVCLETTGEQVVRAARLVLHTEDKGKPVVHVMAYEATPVFFQNGPIRDEGVNGISQESLIAILIDRLEGFQTGKFQCHDNEVALDHLQGARLWLHKRTMARAARGVEGTLKK